MPNLRVIYDNAADRATLSASSTAGTLAVSNLNVEQKSVVWRASTTSATLTASWATPEVITGVALPFCNLTSQATLRVRGYVNAGDAAPLFDSGALPAAPGMPLGVWGWGAAPLGANAYTYGGGTLGRSWIEFGGPVRQLVVDLSDPLNPAGYVEASRLVCGAHWQPLAGADYGASAQPVDYSKNFRNDAGDLMSDPGARSDKLSVPMSKLAPADRATLWSLLRGNGIIRPVFISLFPNDPNPALEQAHQLYGKLVATPAMSLPSFNIASATLEIEGV